MRQDKLSKQNVILYLCGIIPVVWLGLLIAPCLKDGLPGLVQQFGSVMQNPFQIQLCEDSVKTAFQPGAADRDLPMLHRLCE